MGLRISCVPPSSPQAIKEALEGLEARLVALEEELQREGQRLPNMTHPGGWLHTYVLRWLPWLRWPQPPC